MPSRWTIRRYTGPPTPPCGEVNPDDGHVCTLPRGHTGREHMACDPVTGDEISAWMSPPSGII
jgi:hypothetical protein